jgi:hypothetical protein
MNTGVQDARLFPKSSDDPDGRASATYDVIRSELAERR